jgi:hypothetical protein
VRAVMNFNFELTSRLKKAKDGEDHDFEVSGFVDADLFVINEVKVYAPAMDEYFDCTEMFKSRQSFVEAISDMAHEDYHDSKLGELLEELPEDD